MLKQSLQLTQSQSLTMTPQLQQAIRLLQWTTAELRDHLERMLEINVLLERDERAPESPWPKSIAPTLGNSLPEIVDAGDESLRAHLLEQLELVNLPPRELALAIALVDALDEDGYLSETLQQIATDLTARLPAEPAVTTDELAQMLQVVQTLEPVGVGARSLAECLGLQLTQLEPQTPGLALARQIVTGHLELLALRDPVPLRRAVEADEESLAIAVALVRGCHPRPGSGFGALRPQYVIPDVVARRTREGWRVELAPGALPRITLNQHYATLLGRAPEYSTLRAQLQEARWLLRSVDIRNDTLLRVARAIVAHQSDVLEHGEERMQPLVLRDIARQLELHESTVSRITSGKYLLTPRGVFELRYFFSSRIDDPQGRGISSTSIRARIRRMLQEEDPANPLPDAEIARQLAAQGIPVARRTVTKYRESLGIDPSTERKGVGSR